MKMHRAVLLSMLLLGLGSTAHAAVQECASNFKASGAAESGLQFETAQEISGLDAGKAIGQLRQIATGDGFQLGADGGEGAR